MATAEEHNDGRFSIDIRLFLAIVTMTLTVSFMAGIYGVTDTYYKTADVGSYYETKAIQYLFPNLFPSNSLVTKDNDILPNSSAHFAHDNLDAKISEEVHRPSGQHLLVDIKGVDGDFLNSEERLSKALVDTVKETG